MHTFKLSVTLLDSIILCVPKFKCTHFVENAYIKLSVTQSMN